MRYDTPIYMQTIRSGDYNPDTGDYEDGHIDEVEQIASVMDTGAEIMKLIYGGLKQGSLTIHLQNRYLDPFDRIRIGEKIYAVDASRRLRVKQSFVVSEVL